MTLDLAAAAGKFGEELQLLVAEFRFDSMPNTLQAIEDGRVKWRRRQLAAMARDDPEEAARVLRDATSRAGWGPADHRERSTGMGAPPATGRGSHRVRLTWHSGQI